MKYNFDEIIDRGPKSESYSAKWQGYSVRFPDYKVDEENTLPMWVADMDFKAPSVIVDAIVKRAEHGIYGYSAIASNQSFFEAATGWFDRRYNYKADVENMIFFPGIVPAANTIIQEFSAEGEGVIIQTPVYYPFAEGIRKNNRVIIENPLIEKDGYYQMDFEDLEAKAKEKSTKLMILCSPHNPVGRVWSREDIECVMEICINNNVLLFSDEIHADLIIPGVEFFTAGRSEKYKDNLILAHSASKTFNLAGLSASIVTVPNKEIRERLSLRALNNHMPSGNTFGPIAGAAGYRHCDDYVDELMAYIDGNFKLADEFLKANMPNVKFRRPEGTYLAWIDFNGTGLTPNEIYRKSMEEAKVAGDFGNWFGEAGDGFIRFNFACPRSTIVEMLNRLKKAFA